MSSQGIRRALEELGKVQLAVEISEPIAMRVQEVYPAAPFEAAAISTPSCVNQWRFVSEDRLPGGFRRLHYVVRVQVFVAENEGDFIKTAGAAAALHDELISALDANLQLNGSASISNVRSDDTAYMPIGFERNGVAYIGLQYLVDLTIDDVQVFGS